MAGQISDLPTPPLPPQQEQHRAMPTRNPMPLSASQEAQVRELYHSRVRKICDAELQAFSDCSTTRTLTVTYACRDEIKKMTDCMVLHATQKNFDEAREEWFAKRGERFRQRRVRAKIAAAQEEFIHDWWGLPEDVSLSGRKSKLKKPPKDDQAEPQEKAQGGR